MSAAEQSRQPISFASLRLAWQHLGDREESNP